MKNAIFWDVALCRSCLQQPARAGSSLTDFSTLKMEAIRSSKTSVHRRSTQCHIPQTGILQVKKKVKDWFNGLAADFHDAGI
jgi:hypothetical protein